jgi:hypothetical protein
MVYDKPHSPIPRTFLCPHCRAVAHHEIVACTPGDRTNVSWKERNTPVIGWGPGGVLESFRDVRQSVLQFHVVLRCNGCSRTTYRLVRDGVEGAEPGEELRAPVVLHQHPWQVVASDPSFPTAVSTSAREASLCSAAGAWNACGTMVRRAMQAMAVDKNAKPSAHLGDQLAELKVAGVLTAPLHEWASELRFDGNTGAHPTKGDLTKSDCEALMKFLEEILDHVYVHPARLAAKRQGKAAAPSTSPPPGRQVLPRPPGASNAP